MSLFGNTVGFAPTNLLSKSGGRMDGFLDMNGNPITGLPEPEEESHAANMGYVERQAMSEAAKQITDRILYCRGGKNMFDVFDVEPSNNTVKVTVSESLYSTAYRDPYPYYHGLMIESVSAGTNQCGQTSEMWLKANQAYTMSATLEKYNSGDVRFAFRDAESKSILKATPYLTEPGRYGITYTPTEDVKVRFSFFVTGSTSKIGSAHFTHIMVERSEFTTEYEPQYVSLPELTDIWRKLDAAYQEGVNSV